MLACVLLSLSLRPPPRREALRLGAASLASTLPPLLPTSALEAPSIQRTVSQPQLLASLASAPPRDIVLTGANSGVGLAAAQLLTAAGHRVVCACRTQAKADAAAAQCRAFAAAHARRGGGGARGAACDLSSLRSVREFAASLRGAPVDTLALNAGVARGTAEAEARRTSDGFEETVGVNHLGHFLLASLLVPNLEAAARPRLVVTASPVHDPTSGGGNVGAAASLGDLAGLAAGPGFSMVDGGVYDADKAYKDSKLCNMLFMAEASRRFAAKGITVNAFSPGLIADPKGFFRNQNQVFATIFNTITKVAGVADTNEFGGSALAYMAVDPALDDVTGAWYDTLPPGKHQLAVHAASDEARDVEKQKRLWMLSSELVGLA
ncbi:hypothetical protein AB1Y20_010278 [Prymnesium parvum]|uniref:protochlorophyllide reductase n=1 Tax=Prymnesium parvum TaxID=97485 RepID=A0AB34K7H8_PRYPA